MPIVAAYLRGTPAALSSAREKPRPARTRRLYFRVGQRTTGYSLDQYCSDEEEWRKWKMYS